jgi:hypothetical protein
MVAGFLDAIAKVRQFKFHNDDDLYDRLSRRFSVVLLMLFTVVVSTKQYVGDPIACFAPAQFTGKYVLGFPQETVECQCRSGNELFLPFLSVVNQGNDISIKRKSFQINFLILLCKIHRMFNHILSI